MTLSSPLFCTNTSVKDSKNYDLSSHAVTKSDFHPITTNERTLSANDILRLVTLEYFPALCMSCHGVHVCHPLHGLKVYTCMTMDECFYWAWHINLKAFWLFNKVYWCTFFQFSFFSSETGSSFFPNILLFNLDNAAFIFPIGPVLFVESTASNLREERLWKEPKAIATTVQARQITLYGILKSGVGRVMSRISVWRRRNTSSSGAASMLKRYYRKLHRMFL